MNPLSLLASPLVRAGLIGVVCLLTGYLTGCNEGKKTVQAAWDQERLAAQAAYIASLNAARTQEQNWQNKVQEAENGRKKAETELKTLRASLGNELDGLRGELAFLRSGLSEESPAALRFRTSACYSVFADCAGKYSELAQNADECAADREALMNAWPDGK